VDQLIPRVELITENLRRFAPGCFGSVYQEAEWSAQLTAGADVIPRLVKLEEVFSVRHVGAEESCLQLADVPVRQLSVLLAQSCPACTEVFAADTGRDQPCVEVPNLPKKARLRLHELQAQAEAARQMLDQAAYLYSMTVAVRQISTACGLGRNVSTWTADVTLQLVAPTMTLRRRFRTLALSAVEAIIDEAGRVPVLETSVEPRRVLLGPTAFPKLVQVVLADWRRGLGRPPSSCSSKLYVDEQASDSPRKGAPDVLGDFGEKSVIGFGKTFTESPIRGSARMHWDSAAPTQLPRRIRFETRAEGRGRLPTTRDMLEVYDIHWLEPMSTRSARRALCRLFFREWGEEGGTISRSQDVVVDPGEWIATAVRSKKLAGLVPESEIVVDAMQVELSHPRWIGAAQENPQQP